MKKIVGIKANYYAEKRNFSGLDLPDFRFELKTDFYKFPAYLYYKFNNDVHPRWLNLFWDFDLNNAEIYHFFNAISLGKKPWIVTFETYVPRGVGYFGDKPKENSFIHMAMEKIAKPPCKRLLALSNYAYSIQKLYLEKYGKYQDEILAKTEVFHPPQKLYFQNIDQKPISDKIRFTIIGRTFFHKGGKEVLHAFNEMNAIHKNIELHIVSTLEYNDYGSRSTKQDQINALKIIKSNPNIFHYPSLPNEEVIELLKITDVGLLPSHHETYGYSVLESQACGCPVITTNGGAFTEFNNNERGWIIELPIYENMKTVTDTPESKKVFTKIVTRRLKEIIDEIANNPQIVRKKGQKSIENIYNNHSIDKAQKRLNQIYLDSLL